MKRRSFLRSLAAAVMLSPIAQAMASKPPQPEVDDVTQMFLYESARLNRLVCERQGRLIAAMDPGFGENDEACVQFARLNDDGTLEFIPTCS